VHNQEHRLYEEFGALARFVDNARKAISAASPQIISSSTQLPTAASHLSDLSKMTEEGTLEVMRLTEMMQDNHGQIAKDLSAIVEVLRAMDCATLAGRLGNLTCVLAQDSKYLTEIMTALIISRSGSSAGEETRRNSRRSTRKADGARCRVRASGELRFGQ
jgi:chemotaxis protein CheZ